MRTPTACRVFVYGLVCRGAVGLEGALAFGVALMNKEMIISASGHETMAAILEDDAVVEIFVERDKSRGVAGNIYKGRVNKVLPGMQSAFVDVGLERDAFLYVSDVIDALEEFERLEAGDSDDEDSSPRGDRPDAKIDELLKAGQEILVQVVKEPLGTKGARITSHVTIPGRFLVFTPTVDHIGVSRKIDARDERGRSGRDFRTSSCDRTGGGEADRCHSLIIGQC